MFKQYQLANGGSEGELIQSVNAGIKDGWQPIGGITAIQVVINGVQQARFLQAMGHS